jgi:hypothetical protein
MFVFRRIISSKLGEDGKGTTEIIQPSISFSSIHQFKISLVNQAV